MAQKPRGLFITGNNTEVGKTWVAALIAKALMAEGLSVGVYKPAASGGLPYEDGLVSPDTAMLWQATGERWDLEDICPQTFAAELAPHLAARAQGREIDTKLLRTGLNYWTTEQEAGRCDFLLVEGAGGLMSPLSDEDYVADLAHEFGLPVIVVAANRLGVINETLQTLITAAHYKGGLPVAGVVLNDAKPPSSDASRASNRAELKARCRVPILAHVPHGASTLPEPIDWQNLAAT